MSNSFEQLIKDGIKEFAPFFSKPHKDTTAAFEAITKIADQLEHLKDSFDPLFIDTLSYGLLCQIDFLHNIMLLRPSSVYTKWFLEKTKANLSILETMAGALIANNPELYNEAAGHLIENNMAFEKLELALLIEQRIGHIIREPKDHNRAYFYQTVDQIMSMLSSQEPHDQILIDRLIFALFFLEEKPYQETAEKLLPKIINIINPSFDESQKNELRQEALELAKKLPPKSFTNYWYPEQMLLAEKKETASLIKQLKAFGQLNLVETLLSDGFTLLNSFKRRYAKENSNYIAFGSAARACLLARNLLYTLPSSQHPEIFKATLSLLDALDLFLANRFGEPSEKEKANNIQKAAAVMKESFQTLLNAADGLKQRHH